MLLPLVAALLAQSPTLPASSPAGLQTGVLTPPLGGSLTQGALAWANFRTAELRLDPRTTLRVGPAFSTRFGGTVHLPQTVGGVPVHGASVVVTFDTLRRVVRASSSLQPVGQVLATPAFSGDEALRIASRAVDGALLRPDGQPWGGWRRELFRVGDDLHAGYLTYVPTLVAKERFHVAVDAISGAVLFIDDRVHAASTDAAVYVSSPGGLQAGIGVTPLVTAPLSHLGAGHVGTLTGERIRALNCCPTLDCDPASAARRVTGELQTFGGSVAYDMAICDRLQRATNDATVHASGDYVYAPVDPPSTSAPSIASPADYDEFAEVSAYYHANKAYDALEVLSEGPLAPQGFSPFALRRTGPDLPAVWVNANDPDFQQATRNAQGVLVGNALVRTDNAMYVALEQMEALTLPEQQLASDALLIYQGNAADFAYDGPVLWHEFGHGAIHSTSNWDMRVSIDARSANNEGQALHEGCADIIAAMVGDDPVVGAYVGPRMDSSANAIRDLDNDFKCPDVLWGESHQDSQHFTGAVWAARKYFMALDGSDTFDAAFYAALVSFPLNVDFASAAAIITDQVALAFPNVSDARERMTAFFTERGVIGCSKVVEVTRQNEVRPYFNVPGSTYAGVTTGAAVPGPYQLKLHLPRGARRVTVTGMQYFGNSSRLQVLARALEPVTFARNNASLVNDAELKVTPTVSQGRATAVLDVNVVCGDDLYIAIANVSGMDRTLYDLSVSWEEAASCPTTEPEPEPEPEPQPEPQVMTVQAASDALGAPLEGCGCGVTPPLALLPFGLVVLRRRRRR